MPEASPASADWFLALFEDPAATRRWLAGLGIRDEERGARDLRDLARLGGTRILARIAVQLNVSLPRCPDAGMALSNIERFVAASPDPRGILQSLIHQPRTTDVLVQLFSTSQHFSELMIREPSLLNWLQRQAVRRDRTDQINELWNDLAQATDEQTERLILRRFQKREMLRIGYDDIVRSVPLEITTLDLSDLADTCVEAAYRLARHHTEARYGIPRGIDGAVSEFVVLALGKLGGSELNYSSDIDLIFLYDEEGQTDGPRPIHNAEFFAKMGSEIVRLLSDHTALGLAYRVDMRLRPEGEQGALARSLGATLGYYETSGRTWEHRH